MIINNFNKLVSFTKSFPSLRLSIAMPHNEHILESLYLASKKKLIVPYISGNKKLIENIANHHNIDLSSFTIFDLEDSKSLENAIELVKSGECNVLMKGDHSTASIMSLVLKKSNNLIASNVISHIYLLEIPTYHKLLIITDGALNIAPNLKIQECIIENAINFSNILGVRTPKVALLSAVEVPTDKMPTTISSQILANNLNLKKKAILEGPIAFDAAISKDASLIKHIPSDISGDIDIAFAPYIEVNNVLAKALIYLSNAKAAGLIVGAKVPIILTSRSDSAESKFLSIALASLYNNGEKNV